MSVKLSGRQGHPCEVEGCPKWGASRVNGEGPRLCTTHRRQMLKWGEIRPVDRPIKPELCEAPKCDRAPQSRSGPDRIWLCNAHRMQVANGKPLTPLGSTVRRAAPSPPHVRPLSNKDRALTELVVDGTFLARFWIKVEVGDPDECWEWTAAPNKGYGEIGVMFEGKSIPLPAHRVVASFAHDVSGRDVLHTCDNPPCVNPAHLYLGDAAQNAADMVSRGRHTYGSRNGAARLNELQVAQIKARLRAGERYVDIAPDFGVSAAAIGHIRHGRAWRQVDAVALPSGDSA